MDQQHTLRVSINILSDISKEKFQKVVFTNILNQCKQNFDIDIVVSCFIKILNFIILITKEIVKLYTNCNGLVLKQSTITQLKQDILKDINCTYQKDEILSLIYPMKHNNHSIIMVVNLQNDGIYEQIKIQRELFKGEEYYVGLPSGQNKQLIQIQNDKIIINSQSFVIKENMEIVFVKKIQDNNFEQIQMTNPSKFSSSKHAHIKVQNGRIFLFDGFQQEVSKNGVWILVKHQRFSNQSHYCFKDFRLSIGMNN